VDVVTEHVDVEAADGVADSLFVHPAEGVHPAVVAYMDAYGIRPSLEALAERLASHGYAVFVPNVLYRDGRSPVAENLDEQMRAEDRAPLWAILVPKIRRLTPDVARADAKAWMAYVRSRPEADPGPVGTGGYCMGGRLSLRMAGQFPDVVAAAASFHGGGLATEEPDSPHLAAVDAGGELYVGHADNDGSMPPEQMARLTQALADAHVRHTAELYVGAAHGWTQVDTPAYHEPSAERHWMRMLELFGRVLSA